MRPCTGVAVGGRRCVRCECVCVRFVRFRRSLSFLPCSCVAPCLPSDAQQPERPIHARPMHSMPPATRRRHRTHRRRGGGARCHATPEKPSAEHQAEPRAQRPRGIPERGSGRESQRDALQLHSHASDAVSIQIPPLLLRRLCHADLISRVTAHASLATPAPDLAASVRPSPSGCLQRQRLRSAAVRFDSEADLMQPHHSQQARSATRASSRTQRDDAHRLMRPHAHNATQPAQRQTARVLRHPGSKAMRR